MSGHRERKHPITQGTREAVIEAVALQLAQHVSGGGETRSSSSWSNAIGEFETRWSLGSLRQRDILIRMTRVKARELKLEHLISRGPLPSATGECVEPTQYHVHRSAYTV